ncbi:NUDIX domain-containing protein [Candidatus Woesearchaeota archaeon]|nr:NUDIX domain-containing protein [Candidatus Woesearchaeota archaeon]
MSKEIRTGEEDYVSNFVQNPAGGEVAAIIDNNLVKPVGGKIEEGETPETANARETKEEIGLDITVENIRVERRNVRSTDQGGRVYEFDTYVPNMSINALNSQCAEGDGVVGLREDNFNDYRYQYGGGRNFKHVLEHHEPVEYRKAA